MDTGTWKDDGLCAQVDPEVWFPDKGESTRPAKRICARCPVRVPCLDYALDHGIRHGVWGGLSYPERRHLTREQEREAA